MDRDTFIITVFWRVKRNVRARDARRPVRRGGFAPALSDEELIAMEICGEYFKLHKDCDLYDYFATHYRHFFPRYRTVLCSSGKPLTCGTSRPPSAIARRAQRATHQPRASDRHDAVAGLRLHTGTTRPVFRNGRRLRALRRQEAG
jgi:hypothetical protein